MNTVTFIAHSLTAGLLLGLWGFAVICLISKIDEWLHNKD